MSLLSAQDRQVWRRSVRCVGRHEDSPPGQPRPGGQAGASSKIENYLGFPNGVSGSDLARRAVTQAQRLGAEFMTHVEVLSVSVDGGYNTSRFATAA
jgi:thioredoxin reductase